MLFWHLAAVTFLFRWIFRDPKVDMRFLAVGALIPDVIDLSVASIYGSQRAELWGHALLVPSLVATGVLLATRRGRKRRGWMALVVAWLFHLLIDGMWADATAFLWPAFGFDLEVSGPGFWSDAIQRASGDPWRWLLEVIGIVYLVWLWRASGLQNPSVRKQLRETGRLPGAQAAS